jgi:hypothetical protein
MDFCLRNKSLKIISVVVFPLNNQGFFKNINVPTFDATRMEFLVDGIVYAGSGKDSDKQTGASVDGEQFELWKSVFQSLIFLRPKKM